MVAIRYRRRPHNEVSLKFSKSFKCDICGKRGVKNKTVTHYISRFNLNEDGVIRNREEVWTQVNAEGEQWKLNVENVHDKCKVE